MDETEFRPNVALIIANRHGEVLVGERKRIADAWQFPQGGINDDETAEQACARELAEETCFLPEEVEPLAATDYWLYYKYPKNIIKAQQRDHYIGQKQKWFLLKLRDDVDHNKINNLNNTEFRSFKWESYWYVLNKIVKFKKEVYEEALNSLYSVYKKHYPGK